ncbi:MAG: hypothetical protein L6Q46_04910 [Flavobacterium sp.]|uniref:hypothetical protein n=1 Tax=Flavobacterium sp. TaxID=239 RepID=UPI0025C6F7F9|nr:hypothetical protein [Flavobacterium sp.]MCK6607631.1 hypothetical protein [Flavobacterium sp.]
MEQKNLELNQLAKEALREGAKWSFFLSIMGFIGVGFMILAALFMTVALSSIPEEATELGYFGALKGFMSFLYFGLAALYFFPIYYLYKYSSNMKTALQFNDQNLLTDAFVNLKSHYKFLGISVIVVISLYILILFGGLFAIASSVS